MKNKIFINGVKRYELNNIDAYYKGRKEYIQYKHNFDYTNQMNALNMPMYVVLEINNYCNMKCKMCIKSYDPNANGNDNMPIDMLDKILKESHDIGVPSFFLGGGTECLINPEILTVINHVKTIGKGIDDVIITNGYCLNDEIIDSLIEHQWEKIFISLDAATCETYKTIRGRDLEIVENNIYRLLSRKKEKKSVFPIIRVSFCIQDDNRNEQEAFFEKWKDLVDIIDYQNMVDSSDMSIRHDLPNTHTKCLQPFNRLFIDCKGNIMACCKLDWCKHHLIGNIMDMTMQEAWNSDRANDLRKSIASGKLCDVCKTCLFHTENNW